MLETPAREDTTVTGTPEDWSAPRGSYEARDEPNTDVGPSATHNIHGSPVKNYIFQYTMSMPLFKIKLSESLVKFSLTF